MKSGFRRLFLCLKLTLIFSGLWAQHRSSFSFSGESNSLLEGIINHVVHSPLPPAVLDARFDKSLPCLFYGQEMFSNYLYLLQEETFEIPQIYDLQNPSQPGFMSVLEQLQIKSYQLEAMMPEMQNTPLPSAQYALSVIGNSPDFKSFRDQFTFLHPKKLTKEEETLVQDIFYLLSPFRSRRPESSTSKPVDFAPIVLVEKSEENEFCKEVEQVSLLFQSMEYPKITWNLSLTYTLHCGCSQTSDQELSYMSSEINTQVASTFRTSSLNNLVFIQTGDPKVNIREVACCTQNFEPNQVWESPEDSVQAGMQIVQGPTEQQNTISPLPEISQPEPSHSPYPVRLGVSPIVHFSNDGRSGIGANLQFLSPVSGPLLPSGKGRILAGVFGGIRSNRWEADSITVSENWSSFGVNLSLSSPIGAHVEWMNGIQGTMGLSRYSPEPNSVDEPVSLDKMYFSYEILSGLGVNLGTVQLQLKVPIVRWVQTGSRPDKITSFAPSQRRTSVLLNGPTPMEFYLNFRLGKGGIKD